jgi:hypothetical protein
LGPAVCNTPAMDLWLYNGTLPLSAHPYSIY